MDDQGLVGAMPTTAMRSALKSAPHAPVRAPHSQAKAPTSSVAQGGVVGARALGQKQSGYDHAIAQVETVRSVANFPFMMMLPGMVGIGAGKLAGWMKRDRTSVVLGGTGDALMNGVRKTSMNKPLHFAADLVETIAENSEKRGGRAAPWAESLNQRSVALREGADRMSASIGKVAAPVMDVAGKGLETVGLKAPAAKAWAKIGRYPLFAGIATVAAGAGIASIWLTRSKQSAEGKDALSALTTQLGANHPVVLQATKIYSQQHTQTALASVLSSIGEGTFVVFEALPHMGMAAAMPMMGAQAGLPMLGQLLVKENLTLDAFAKLQGMEQGTLPNDPAQKVYCYRQLIGAMPQVAEKGGVYNRLGSAMAASLVKENASVAQVMDLLKNPEQFSAYSVKVSHAQQPAAKAANDDETSVVHSAPAMATGPMAKITKAGAAHEGTVVHGYARAANDDHRPANNDAGHYEERLAHTRAVANDQHR